jgi:hypothetical protein
MEDKFDGLELNHTPRWLNEATDELAKMASNQEPVLAGVFSSDQHKPSVQYKEPRQAGDKLPSSDRGARRPIGSHDPSPQGSGARQ